MYFNKIGRFILIAYVFLHHYHFLDGILEYKAPEGALLPETISPSYQQYNNNPSNERTRLLDTTYDSKSHKFRLFDDIQQDFIHDKSYETIIEGGLGKLTDNDTEFKTSTR